MSQDCQQPEVIDHDCSSSEVIVAALDADFLLGTVTDYAAVAASGLTPVWLDHLPPAAKVLVKTCPIRGPDPPDKPAGRDLLVAHQTFLI